MDQIAAFAGTSKAVFYRHFADKADLYRAVGQRLAAELGEQLSTKITRQGDARARIAAGVDGFLAVLDKKPELYRFVVEPALQGAAGDPVAGYTGLIAARIDQLIGQLGPGVQPVLVQPWGTAIVGLVKAAGDWWLDHRSTMSRAELVESLTTLLWAGAAGLQPVNLPATDPIKEPS
jgi:AcrR family transcriptional regulator